VPTGYGYVLPDQNGWRRALHFEAAWIAVLTGLLYIISGLLTRHFRKDLVPSKADLSWRALLTSFAKPLRFERPSAAEASSYNGLQRLTYLFVIFVLFPLVIWSGLAMSLAFASALPWSVTLLGGRQSARTIHFFVSLALVLFLFVHVAMVCLAGFWSRTGAMITGRTGTRKEHTCSTFHAETSSYPDAQRPQAHRDWPWRRTSRRSMDWFLPIMAESTASAKRI